MATSISRKAPEQGKHFILKDSACKLTGHDLSKLFEITEQARGGVRVSHKTHQLWIGVPKDQQSYFALALSHLGFDYTRETRGDLKGSTFKLRRNTHDSAL